MPSRPATVEEYLASLPEDRRHALEELRRVVRDNLHADYEEGIQYGMIGYFLPHSKYPWGYHCDPKQPLPFVSLASQKNHIGLYLFCVYCDPGQKETFVEQWKATGKRLDMGAGCVRVKKLEDVPLAVVGRAIRRATPKRFVEAYEASLEGTGAGKKLAARKARAGAEAPAPPEAAPKRKAAGKKKKAATRSSTASAPARKKASKKRSGSR